MPNRIFREARDTCCEISTKTVDKESMIRYWSFSWLPRFEQATLGSANCVVNSWFKYVCPRAHYSLIRKWTNEGIRMPRYLSSLLFEIVGEPNAVVFFMPVLGSVIQTSLQLSASDYRLTRTIKRGAKSRDTQRTWTRACFVYHHDVPLR